MRRIALGFMLCLAACSTQQQPLPSGDVAQSVAVAADRNGVPRELMLAAGVVEGGLLLQKVRMPDPEDHVPVAGVLELRHGAFDSLARGARAHGHRRADACAPTPSSAPRPARACSPSSARRPARAPIDLASWRRALEALSGMADQASRARYAERRVRDPARRRRRSPRATARRITIARASRAHRRARAVRSSRRDAGTPDFPGAMWFTTSCTNKCDTSAHRSATRRQHDRHPRHRGRLERLGRDAAERRRQERALHRRRRRLARRPVRARDGHRVARRQLLRTTDARSASSTSAWRPIRPATRDGLYAKSRGAREEHPHALDGAARSHAHRRPLPDSRRQRRSPRARRACTDTLDACETSANYGGAANHRDPGYHWQWCQYMERLGGSCTCNDAYALWNCTTDKTEAVRCTDGKVEIDHCDAGCDGAADRHQRRLQSQGGRRWRQRRHGRRRRRRRRHQRQHHRARWRERRRRRQRRRYGRQRRSARRRLDAHGLQLRRRRRDSRRRRAGDAAPVRDYDRCARAVKTSLIFCSRSEKSNGLST